LSDVMQPTNKKQDITLEYQPFDGAKGDEALERIWSAYDVDKSNTINMVEFVALMGDLEMLRMQLNNDPTHSPVVATTDSGMKGGSPISADVEVYQACFAEMDTDGDGEIDKDALFAFARRTGLRTV
jgi:Ca2+-binding EF-hand superfamily protein